MMNKADREALQNQTITTDVVVNRVYSNSLGKGLNKLLKVALHRSKDKKSENRIKANIFRMLVHFRAVLDLEIDKLQQYLIDEDVREFFPAEKEYVEVVREKGEPSYATVKPIKTATEWRLAQKQRKEREK